MDTKGLQTIGDIARQHGIPVERAQYAARKHNITCAQKAGILRLYTDVQAAQIVAAAKRVRRQEHAR